MNGPWPAKQTDSVAVCAIIEVADRNIRHMCWQRRDDANKPHDTETLISTRSYRLFRLGFLMDYDS